MNALAKGASNWLRRFPALIGCEAGDEFAREPFLRTSANFNMDYQDSCVLFCAFVVSYV
jgi:hypothetical protein